MQLSKTISVCNSSQNSMYA